MPPSYNYGRDELKLKAASPTVFHVPPSFPVCGTAASKHDHGQVCSGPAAHERTAHPSVSFPRGLVGSVSRQKHHSNRNTVTFNLALV